MIDVALPIPPGITAYRQQKAFDEEKKKNAITDSAEAERKQK